MNLRALMMVLVIGVSTGAAASFELYEFDSPQQEAQYRVLIGERRRPRCQNQNVAGSDAPIAQDLKQKTYEDVRSDAEMRNDMFVRYGDFISYKPPVRPSTWILWFFPPMLLLLLLLGWIYKAQKGRSWSKQIPTSHAPLSAGEEAKLKKILAHHQNKSLDGSDSKPTK